MVVRTKSVKRYVIVAASSIVSFFILDFMRTVELFPPFIPPAFWSGSYNPPSWIPVMAAIIAIRSLYAFFTIGGVEKGVGVSVKDLLQALPIYGPPAMCCFLILARLGVPSWFSGPNPNLYLYPYWEFESWSFLWVGTVVQEFLRGLLYSQVIRGIPRRAPLAVTILGWHLLAGLLAELVYVYGPLTAYIWFILYWSIISMLAYLIFRAEKDN